MSLLWLIPVFISGLLGASSAEFWNFYMAIPAKLRLDTNATIAIAVEGNQDAAVEVYIQDHPEKLKNITHTTVSVKRDEATLFKVDLDSAHFPPAFLKRTGSPKLVSITAVTDKFQKEILVPITIQSGYVFIETDKQIYTPYERARIRILYLNEDLELSKKPFKLQIMNPDGVAVEEKLFFERERFGKVIEHYIYRLPANSFLGEWSAIVHYGYAFQQKTTVNFELKEYVLPTFTVEMKTPNFILSSTDKVQIEVLAQHVYGKYVQGTAIFRIGLKRDSNITFFANIGPKKLDEGFCEVTVEMDHLKKNKDIGWFPNIEGSELVVEASVIDAATLKIERAKINTRILRNRFIISFKRCPSDFKPGFISIIVANINYIDGEPVDGISTKISVMADGKPLNISKDTAVSDNTGKVSFEILTEVHHRAIFVTLETNDPLYAGSQEVGYFTQLMFQSRNKAYLSIERGTQQRFQPGTWFSRMARMVLFESNDIQNVYYMIISRGKIISMQKLPPGEFNVQQIKFQITHEMVPFFRLLVFAHYRGELLADSLKIDVERVCDPKAKVSVENVFNIREPGMEGRVTISGNPGNWVGLLTVDESMYTFSKKDILTNAKIFNTLACHDFGCSPGGGVTVDQVLENAGIVFGTNHYTPALVITDGEEVENQCCDLDIQQDKKPQNWQEIKNIRQKYLEKSNNSSKKLDCCLTGQVCQQGCYISDDPKFTLAEEEDSFEKVTAVRMDFRDKKLDEFDRIGPDGNIKYYLSLPHSITTWVGNAVSISPQNGICITEQQKVISFQKIFLHLDLPYSVRRNEQVEILATIFNHGNIVLPAVVYMYGVKYLCSGTLSGQKSERKKLIVKPHSSQSISFLMTPLKADIFRIKVVALTPYGCDIIEKDLRVVLEGVTQEIQIPIKLDPLNKLPRQHFETNLMYTESIKNVQVTAVRLYFPECSVPGSASFSITAKGDNISSLVETAISIPDDLFRDPNGNGVTNMMLLSQAVYTLLYLKVTGELTDARELKGFESMGLGFVYQLNFRKPDGTYSAYLKQQASTWLTAFVMKVFCKLKKFLPDQNIHQSTGIINFQELDGSYVEKYPVYNPDILGGVKGNISVTAYVIIAFEECKCNKKDLIESKKRAVTYLENHLEDLKEPFTVAIVAYALALSDSKLKKVANDKLMSMVKRDEAENLMHWETENSAHDIETAGYGLLTQLLFNDVISSSSIVKWLNTKQLQPGLLKSTQDNVIALQSLSKYAEQIKAIRYSLYTNITLSNDRNFHEMLTIYKDSVHVLKEEIKFDPIRNNTLFISTDGYGIGTLNLKFYCNSIVPLERTCNFAISIDVSESEHEGKNTGTINKIGLQNLSTEVTCKMPLPPEHGSLLLLDGLKVNSLVIYTCNDDSILVGASASKCLISGEWTSPPPKCEIKSGVQQQDQMQDMKSKYNLSICVKYLGYKDAEMSIVDVGIFPGFEPDFTKLEELEYDPNNLIQMYQISSRGVIFYLKKVPIDKNYCFSFPVIRIYNTSQELISVIKVYEVYDYYKSNKNCTTFYSPANRSMLLKFCEGDICECVESGCPSNQALQGTAALERSEKTEEIRNIICDNYDYIWKGKLNSPPVIKEGFMNNTFLIEEVISEGIERKINIEGKSRTLLSREYCQLMIPGQTYVIAGKERMYMDSEGISRYHYILDSSSIVHMWTSVSQAKDRELQHALHSVLSRIAREGCLLS